MSLSEYKKKRDFNKTSEPKAKIKKSGKGKLFVVQKHAASHLHYDFRLEKDGTLLSWAVPKGPSLNPADKRLAVHVENHPIDYGSFEGIIPKGEYGGGAVVVWDKGRWKENTESDYKKGRLKFLLEGKKLKGAWALVRMGDSKSKNWLLIKEKDTYSSTTKDVLKMQPESVQSKKTIEKLLGIMNGETKKTPKRKIAIS